MTEQGIKQPESKKSSNKTVIIILAVVGLLIILGVGGNFVWGWVAKKGATKIAEKAIESGTGGNVKLDQGSWPSGVASELQYPGSKVSSSAEYSDKTTVGKSISLETSAGYETVYNYYAGLSGSGWSVSYKQINHDSKGGSLILQKDSDSASIGIDEEDGNTAITIIFGQE